MKNTWDDILWLKRFQDLGTRDTAFRELVETYQRALYAQIFRFTANHDDTDDLLQEVFLKAWTHLVHFRQESKISTWLYRVAYNECLNFLKKSKKNTAWPEGECMLAATNGFTEEEADALQNRLQQAINSLPPKQKAIFCYRYFDEMPYAEIARISGTSEGALKASYFHAAQKIEEFLLQV